MSELYTRFIHETFDQSGRLVSYTYDYAPNFNFGYDIIDPLGEECPQKLAMIWENDKGEQVRLTFREIKERSNQAANLFRSRGLKQGDVLMAALRTHWEYWIVAIAAHKLGLLLSPVYYRLPAQDLVYRMEKAKAKAVICCQEGETVLRVREAADTAGLSLRFTLGEAEGFENFSALLPQQPTTLERVETGCYDPMLLYFTSGTTGDPKGVLHDYAYTLANHCGARYMQDTTAESRHFATGDSGWEVLAGTKFYCQWMQAATILVYDYDRFPPEKVLAFLEREKATGVMAQPTVYRKLTQVGMDKYDLSSVTCFAVGGEKLNDDLANTVFQQTGQVLYEGYAQSETGLIAAASKNMGRKEGSVGKILPKYHVELLKEDGTFAQPGEEGEIVIVADNGQRPNGLMMGYLDDPEATRRLWDGNLFHTGDSAVMDEDRFLFYRGRSDGLIKTKGYRVSPVEIENALSLHPAVEDCLAVGEPDPDLGQKVKVYVTLAQGYTPSPQLEEELMTFHNASCAGFKKIRALEFVPHLARNSNGKLIRGQFRGKN